MVWEIGIDATGGWHGQFWAFLQLQPQWEVFTSKYYREAGPKAWEGEGLLLDMKGTQALDSWCNVSWGSNGVNHGEAQMVSTARRNGLQEKGPIWRYEVTHVHIIPFRLLSVSRPGRLIRLEIILAEDSVIAIDMIVS
jgi:hypothetical protein